MSELKPRAPIRRFDVFAEYNRLKAMDEEKMPSPQAKGYGIWVAKVVAAQKFGRLPKPKPEEKKEREEKEEKERRRKWHTLSGIPQTDKLFDKEIVTRMGTNFYRRVFAPAIKTAYQQGKEYRDIRDTIRAKWKP